MNATQLDPAWLNIRRFVDELQAQPHQVAQLQRLLAAPPPRRCTEIADRGLQSRLGQQLRWPDIATPSKDFCPFRVTLGVQLLLETAESCGLIGSDFPPISAWIKQQAPVRHIRQSLAADLIHAAPLEPWPGMMAPYPSGLLVCVPQSVFALETDGRTEPLALLGIRWKDTAAGLALQAAAWGNELTSALLDWGEAPNHSCSLSRLAWGITGLLCSEPQLVEIDTPQPRAGMIRNKVQRPAPSWIAPPVRYVRRAVTGAGDHRGPVRGHWRRAHLHRYRCGPKRKQLVEHWRPAEWVGGGEN